MPYHPCGRICDFARRTYKTKARFFRDSDIEIGIEWRKASPGATVLGFPSRILSNDWDNDRHTRSGPGEVFHADRVFINKPPMPFIPNHVCGTPDDFLNGATFDPLRPLTQYQPSGLPLCCDPNRREALLLVVPRVVSHTIRSDPRRSLVPVSVRLATTTIRSDPHHSLTTVVPQLVTTTDRSDPHHSLTTVVPQPVAVATTTPPGVPVPGVTWSTARLLTVGTVYSYPHIISTMIPHRDWFRFAGLTVGSTYRLSFIGTPTVTPSGPFDDDGSGSGPPSTVVGSGSGFVDIIAGEVAVVLFFESLTRVDPYYFHLNPAP